MDATTSALVQITHIQFLTLLYPSRLEQRLVLFLLGSLALLSASMELLPIHQNQTTVNVADTIRNTCNAALSLLFTAALFLWGFAINRKQAWRTDGGTAVFGGAALALANISTALNILYIATKDQYLWLPSLIWALVLWQGFLGWWWVGSGRGVGEVEELLRREERRERKRKARAARRTVRKVKVQALWRNASETLRLHRRVNAARTGSVLAEEGKVIEMTDHLRGPNVNQAAEASSASTTTGSPTTTETRPDNMLSRLCATPPVLALSHFYHPLRRVHLETANGQALNHIRDFNPDSWRNLIGVVPQDPVLFTGTIASNIAFGNSDATREQIEEAARQANCEFVWGKLKESDTEIGRLSLSSGQRQRLAIACALLKKPLAMDEATSSLDATSEYRVNDAIDKILSSTQTPCMIVAHRISTIARAERIVVLEGGKITEAGTYRQLVSRPNSRFRALMAAQLDTTTADILVSSNSRESEPNTIDDKNEAPGEPEKIRIHA